MLPPGVSQDRQRQPNWREARQAVRDELDLKDHELIGFASASASGAWVVHRNGKAQTLKIQTRMVTNTADVAIGAAVAGRGITRVLSYQVDDEIAAGRLELVLPEYSPPSIPVHVVHRETGQVAGRVRAVVDHLVGALRTHRSLRQSD